MFAISPINPLRFIDTSDVNAGFDGNFALNQLEDYQNPRCYYQKWKRGDILKLQVLSDTIPEDLFIKTVQGDVISDQIPWAEVPTVILDQTFKVYQIEYSVSDVPDGKYYAEFEYTDTEGQPHILESERFDINANQPNTVLIKYTNSQNDFDVIFDTKIEFQFRVEASIQRPNFQNDRAVYTDQRINPTQLSATPYKTFSLFIGYKWGVPEWIIDKVNWIQSVDQVFYNNVMYQVVDEAEFEPVYNDDNKYMGASIEVQPIQNNFLKYTTVDGGSANKFTPMQKVVPYYNVGANMPIPGLFKNASILEYISVYKRSGAIIYLNVGTTPGGTEIGEFIIDSSEWSQTIMWLFSSTTTIYLSGLSGSDLDIFVVYKQLDEPEIDLGDLTSTIPAPLAKGSTMLFMEVSEGELDEYIDMSTGLGRQNGPWAGWAVSGTNGTRSLAGKVPVGLDEDDVTFNTLYTVGGEKMHLLTIAEMPSHSHGYSGVTNPGGSGTGGRTNVPQNKETNQTGGDQAHNNLQPYIVCLWMTKLTNS